MKKLSAERHQAAVTFLKNAGRKLDAELYRYGFERGEAEPVLKALAAYQNKDGGYGHCLEPDAVAAESSVLDTTQALQVMQRLRVSADHPQVKNAMAYLRASRDCESGVWPLRPFAAVPIACAPWWTFESKQRWREDMETGRFNPTAEVLGYFLEYGQPEDRGWLEEGLIQVERWVDETDEPLESHRLLCLARLTRARGLDEVRREAWVSRVRRDVAAVVETDPANWKGYGLKPWWIAETPDDPLLAGLAPGLADAMLEYEMGRQEDDGGWPPFWDWGGLHADEWAAARVAWKSVLTEQMLRTLRAFGSLPG